METEKILTLILTIGLLVGLVLIILRFKGVI